MTLMKKTSMSGELLEDAPTPVPSPEPQLVQKLRNMGLVVVKNEPFTDTDETYTVSNGSLEALLDMSSFEVMQDSLATIKATFELDDTITHTDNLPLMKQNTTDHTLAPRVAAIGEVLPVKATAMRRGQTTHHDVLLDKSDNTVLIDGLSDRMPADQFMRGSGPLIILVVRNDESTVVNADEIRDVLVTRLFERL